MTATDRSWVDENAREPEGSLPPHQLTRAAPFDPASALNVERFHHRREHLDAIEAELASRA